MPLSASAFRCTPRSILRATLVVLLCVIVTAPAAFAAPGPGASHTRTSAIAPPQVTAQGIYVYDMTAGVELYAKDPFGHRQVGSIVKLATALVVIENAELDEQVKIIEDDLVDTTMYSNMALHAGDTLTVSQLLYGLLIPSGNDGARALARHVGSKLSGSEDSRVATEAFVKEMNSYAASIGLTDSRFTVPDGIDAPNSYSCAHDVTILAQKLMENDFLRSVVSEPGYRFYSVGPEGRLYEMPTTNDLLGQYGIVGVKTGTTVEAGGNVILARQVNDGANTVLISIIGADHAYANAESGEGGVDLRWDDARAIIGDMDQRFLWTAPNADGVLPGLSEQMAVWDVQFQSPPAIPIPLSDVEIGYRLQLGPVADPGKRAGSVHIFYGEDEVGAVPIYQAGESASLRPVSGMAA